MSNIESNFEVYDRNKVLNKIRKQQNLIKHNVWCEVIAHEDDDENANKSEIGSHVFSCYAKDFSHAKELARSNFYSHKVKITDVEEASS